MVVTDYLRIARRWWWALLAGLILGGAAAFAFSTFVLEPSYESRATLLVAQQQQPDVVQLNDLQASERLANTFSRLATLRPVLEQAITDGDLPFAVEELEDKVNVTNPRSTQLLEVRARDGSPQTAAQVANAISAAFIKNNQEELGSRPGVVSIVETALPALDPVTPRTGLNVAFGAIVVLMLVTGGVLLWEYLDDTVKDADEVQEQTGLTTLGVVSRFDEIKNPRDQLQSAMRPRSPAAESYRTIRTNLAYQMDFSRGGRVLVLTSPGPGEGKTTTLANLAVVFGLTGRRVLAIDTDLRRPTLHNVLGVRNTTGFSNLLLSPEPDLQQAVQSTPFHNVSVLTAGPLPPNPSELLGSARMARVLDELRQHYDLVLLDSPPVLLVTDASVMATMADGLLLVARAAHTRTGALRASAMTLARTGRPVLGVVLNRAAERAGDYYYGGRDYYGVDTKPDSTATEGAAEPERPRFGRGGGRSNGVSGNGASSTDAAEAARSTERAPGE